MVAQPLVHESEQTTGITPAWRLAPWFLRNLTKILTRPLIHLVLVGWFHQDNPNLQLNICIKKKFNNFRPGISQQIKNKFKPENLSKITLQPEHCMHVTDRWPGKERKSVNWSSHVQHVRSLNWFKVRVAVPRGSTPHPRSRTPAAFFMLAQTNRSNGKLMSQIGTPSQGI